MVDISTGGSASPKSLPLQHWYIPDNNAEDSSPKSYRRSALRLIASRILVKRDEQEKPPPMKRIICEGSPIHRTKMNILARNPAIYETFRDGLKENFYTHWGVSYSLQQFLDNQLLIPELNEDIVNHPLNRCQKSRGLFAYLGTAVNGSPLPSRQRQRTCSISSPSRETKESMARFVDNISLPSLDKIEQSSDDDDEDDDDDQSNGILCVECG